MSEKVRKQKIEQYDYNKNIKNLEVHPSYIQGLQRVVSKMMLAGSEEQQLAIPQAIEKFNKIIFFDPEKSDYKIADIQMDEWESDIYVLMSLIQLFKYHANDQGITSEVEVDVREDLHKDFLNQMQNGEGITQEFVDEVNQLGKKIDILRKV